MKGEIEVNTEFAKKALIIEARSLDEIGEINRLSDEEVFDRLVQKLKAYGVVQKPPPYAQTCDNCKYNDGSRCTYTCWSWVDGYPKRNYCSMFLLDE